MLLSLRLLFSLNLITLLFFACSDQNNVNLKLENEIIYKTGYNIPPQTFCIRATVTDGSSYVFILDKEDNAILKIKDFQDSTVIKYPQKGPNGIGRLTGFSIVNNEYLYLSSSGRTGTYISDFRGQLLDTWDYSHEGSGFTSTYLSLSSRTHNDIIKTDGRTCILQQVYASASELSEWDEMPPLVVCRDEYSNNNFLGKFPSDYYDNGYQSGLMSSCASFDSNEMIISIRASHNLYKLDLNTGQATTIPAKSEYFSKFPAYKNGRGIDGLQKHITDNFHYENIISDPYRQLYYRFVRHPNDDYEEQYLYFHYLYPSKFSIQIIDRDLNVIGETLLNGNIYNMYNYFVLEDGLYISKNNPNAPNYDEDTYAFDVYIPSNDI